MSVETQEDRIWWHTVLQVASATALFVPVLLLIGLLLVVLSFLQGGGIGILLRAGQYGLASFLCLYLPSLLLKRSHAVIAATVWCTAVTSIYIFMLALSAAVDGGRGMGFWEWLETFAGIVGFVGGSIAYAQADKT